MTDRIDHGSRDFRIGSRLFVVAVLGLIAGGGALTTLMMMRPSPLQQAQAAVQRGDRQVAQQQYEAHLLRQPGDDQARREYAQLFLPGKPQKALEQLKRVPEGSAQHAAALRQVAQLSLQVNDRDGARQALQALEQVNRDDVAVQLSLAELEFQDRDFEKALEHVRRSIELQPELAESHLFLADVLDELGRTAEMIEPLRRACTLQPEHYTAHVNLAYACLYAGDLDCAEQEARWCLKRNGKDASVYRMLARVARDRGNHEEALRQIGMALSLNPVDQEARLLEADVLLFQQQADAAYQKLKPLASSPHNRRRILSTLMRAAALSGRAQEAAEYQAELRRLAAEDRLSPISPSEAAPAQ